MPDTPQNIRDLIVRHCQLGRTPEEIAGMFFISVTTVNNIWNRFQATGSSAATRRGRCGRPRMLSPATSHAIRDASLANPRLTARQIQQQLGGPARDASLSTIQATLRREGLVAYRPVLTLDLDEAKKAARLQWAQQHIGWTAAQWRRVIFSDETAIQIGAGNQSPFVRRGRGAPILAAHTRQRSPQRRVVWFWGCITSAGPGPLVRLERTMDTQQYEVILRDRLLPICTRRKIFQHDNLPAHQAASVLQFLQQHDVTVLPWPPSSPDMNAIENVWATLKRELQTAVINSPEDAEREALAIWNSNTIRNNIANVYASMPRRVRKLRDEAGGHTGY